MLQDSSTGEDSPNTLGVYIRKKIIKRAGLRVLMLVSTQLLQGTHMNSLTAAFALSIMD